MAAAVVGLAVSAGEVVFVLMFRDCLPIKHSLLIAVGSFEVLVVFVSVDFGLTLAVFSLVDLVVAAFVLDVVLAFVVEVLGLGVVVKVVAVCCEYFVPVYPPVHSD